MKPGRGAVTALAVAAVAGSVAGPARAAGDLYVTNLGDDTISVVNSRAGAVVATRTAGDGPAAVAITPFGTWAVVANSNSNSVSVFDTTTTQPVGSSLPSGQLGAQGIAIFPDGARAYVTNSASGTLSVVDLARSTVLRSDPVGPDPRGIAITPDGARAYVTNTGAGQVRAIDTRTGTQIGAAIAVGALPRAIAITADGSQVLVANSGGGTVSVVDAGSNTVVETIPVGSKPSGIAIDPSGGRAFVTADGSDDLTVVDTRRDAPVGDPIRVPGDPGPIAFSPDGARAYVASVATGRVTAIDTSDRTIDGPPVAVGSLPSGIAVIPDQGPTASFVEHPGVRERSAVFNAGASGDPDGSVASYEWRFGDGHRVARGDPGIVHRYRRPGSYAVTLRVTDDEGCSTQFVSGGQTASCNGSGAARTQLQVDLEPPRVRLSLDRTQGAHGPIELCARSDQDAAVVVAGRLRTGGNAIGLGRARGRLGAGERGCFELELSRSARRRAARALSGSHDAVFARITVTATDLLGNTSERSAHVRLRQRRG